MKSFFNKYTAFSLTVLKKTTEKIVKKVSLSLGFTRKEKDDNTSAIPIVVRPTTATESSTSTSSNESIICGNDDDTSSVSPTTVLTTDPIIEVPTDNITQWFALL